MKAADKRGMKKKKKRILKSRKNEVIRFIFSLFNAYQTLWVI